MPQIWLPIGASFRKQQKRQKTVKATFLTLVGPDVSWIYGVLRTVRKKPPAKSNGAEKKQPSGPTWPQNK